MLHRSLQKIHSGKSCDLFFRSQKHDHCCTAADHDRIYKNSKCLNQPCLNRLITFRCCCRAGCRSGACFIRKKSSLNSIHQYRTKASCCRLAKSKGLLENSSKNSRKSSKIHYDDQYRNCKIAHRHHRHDHIQNLHRCILSKYDHRSNRNKYNGCTDWRD